MASQHYLARRLFDGWHWHENRTISVEDGVITGFSLVDDSAATVLEGTLVPGFIDVQVNGGGGVLFNQTPTLACLDAMVAAHARFGTTAMLPTLITDDIHKMAQAADTVAEALARQRPGIIGIHFEGPHLSLPKKGIHKAQHIRRLSSAEMALYCRADLGVRLVTAAPENLHPDDIRALVAAGIKVCLGHSDADFDLVQQALAAGASGFTHLFNAMSQLGSRQPGMVGAALTGNGVCGIILDGHHLHPACARLAYLAKGAQGLMLVTDAMAAVGSSDSEFAYFDDTLYRQGDRLTDKDGRLAGSALDMASAVRNAMAQMHIAQDQALAMASRTPAQFLGLADKGLLEPGKQADMVLLDDQGQVSASWIAGKQTWPQP